MKKTLIQGLIGVVTPVQAVVASNAADWRESVKDANLIFGCIVGAASVYLVVRRAVMHTLRDWQHTIARRQLAERLEQDRQTFLERTHRGQ